MEAGINGKCLEFGKELGLPASFYELVQKLGRVDRAGTAEPGTNTYEIHLDLYSYVSLFVRVMQCDCLKERHIQLAQIHEVLRVLLIPTECYHAAMEKYFEWESHSNKSECTDYCSKCLGDIEKSTKRVNKRGLISLLVQQVHGTSSAVSVKDFVRMLKGSKREIFHEQDVPSEKAPG